MATSEPVVIVAYDPTWPTRFETAACELRETVGALLVAIEHVGSTAVPGLAAKPIIDMMAFVPRFVDGFTTVTPLVARGWESLGEYGIPGRHYFRRRRGGRATHHLHMFGVDPQHPRPEIVFRDYLRLHADVAAEYATLKSALAARHRNDREAYTEGKTAFIREALRRAGARQPGGP